MVAIQRGRFLLADRVTEAASVSPPMPDERGRFGPFGGRFVPETLMPALEELESAYLAARADPAFQETLQKQKKSVWH